ncbi:MAG: putative amidophosphoribosyltransferase [Pseudonocardiales bacterium]|nr:putative amidophosphoribosyltransferase [Pseudonocardiales bacterium]
MPGLLAALTELVLPRHCVGCGQGGALLCGACVPRRPTSGPHVGVPVLAAASYDGAVRTALIAYKERGRRDLVRPLAELLSHCLATAGAQLLVPVPSAADASRRRGGDHVLRLARASARRTGARVATPLRLSRSVQDSAGLGALERAANLHRAMRAAPPPHATSAVIIDDIVTTGATLREAVRALDAAGWSVRCCAVVAATPSPLARPPGPVYRGPDLTE